MRSDRGEYGRFPNDTDRDWLGRWCHLSEADLALIGRRNQPATRLGFGVQLATVRALGTFLADPANTPPSVVAAISRQVGVADVGLLVGYSKMPVRWLHTSEIRERFGYHDYGTNPAHRRLVAALYRRCWADDLTASTLFSIAHGQMLDRRILLPGPDVLIRLVGTLRERAASRLWTRIVTAAPDELTERAESLLDVADGDRRSGLDRFRSPPTSPTLNGLVRTLARYAEIRALGFSSIDLGHLPIRRLAGLARHAEDAWVTQLADLAPLRRQATLIAYLRDLEAKARDDVVDVFDVVFGDMQRSARNRGTKRRVSELRTYDTAVAQLHAALGAVLNALHQPDDLTDALEDLRSKRTEIAEAMATVTELMRSPSDPFHDRLIAAYPQIRRFLPDLLAALDLDATPASAPVVEAVDALDEWLDTLPRTTNRPDSEVPTEIVPTSWQRYVHPEPGRVDRAAYACCVLDQLRSGLRRRDIYLPDSRRWGDPRAELLPEPAWEQQRTEACDSLALTPNPKTAVRELIDSLDTAWRQAADRYEANEEFRVEERDGADRVVVTPLDAIEEPTSLTDLRGLVTELMPEVEIADIPLEVHDWTGHLDDYTHISGASTRTTDLHRSVAALLIADACNVGLTPVVDDNDPALNRERLNWVAQNYVRSATHAAASTRLFNHHAALPLAQAWGGGDMASADGMRLVIPVSTIHAGYNPRYFGRQRGSTLYTWMADTHSSFHQTLIPGTQRDSLHTLDGLVANQTTIRPDTVSTDTAGASEIVFALAWALGYRYAPRLADLGDHRLWHANPSADYGPLAGLARNRINTARIEAQWDQICRLTASLDAGTVTPSAIMRTLQRGPNPTSLARALIELGRIIKTLHILTYCDDATYRRDIQRILNRGESRNALARAVFHGQRGQLRQRYQAGQENQLGALGVMINTIVLWQTVYTQAALNHLADQGHTINPDDVTRLSPLYHANINLQGRYQTTSRPDQNRLRPLRTS